MLKKTLAVILTITTLLALSACGLFLPEKTNEEVVTFDVSEVTKTESEVETTVDTSGLDTTEAESSEEDTAETQDSDESTIMSDEEAIELFMLYHSTSEKWRNLDIYTDTNTDDYIEYTSPDGTFSDIYYAISKDYTSSLSEPDVRGNTEIRYGDNDWMQENLRTIFTEEFIQRYFNYEAPRPHLLYRDGKVYAKAFGGAGQAPRHPKNYTILHKSENELAIMCETYSYHYETEENADKISGFWYMKLVKEDGLWFIDEHFSECADIRIRAKDRIPAEYAEAYQKYKDTGSYFWLKYYFEIPEEELAFDESKIIGTFKCIGDLVDGFPEEPEITPYISFYEDGTCRLLVGYEGEKIYIDGTYTISGRETNVVFDVSNTPYSNWTGKRTTAFRFLEDDLMEIGYWVCDNVEAGYEFVRDDNIIDAVDTTVTTEEQAPEIDVWDGTVADGFAAGDGTESSPYQIAKASQLAFLAKSVNEGENYCGKYISLSNDLDLNNVEWTPIGNGIQVFMGNFDGKEHTIKNLNISQSIHYTYEYPNGRKIPYCDSGLFATAQDVSIKNVIIDGATIKIADSKSFNAFGGVLCGTLRTYEGTSVISNINIKNATITADFSAKQVLEILSIGGAIGRIYAYNNTTTEISLIETDCTVSCINGNGYNNYIGTIIGSSTIWDSTFALENCAAYQTLLINLEQYYYTSTKDFCGAIGNAQASVKPFNVKNVFSKITINKPELDSAMIPPSAIVSHAIIGEAYYYALKDDPTAIGYKFENVFGCVEHIDKTGEKQIFTKLYELPSGLDFAQVNCQGCDVLPENHGFDTSVWDLSDLTKPKLK